MYEEAREKLPKAPVYDPGEVDDPGEGFVGQDRQVRRLIQNTNSVCDQFQTGGAVDVENDSDKDIGLSGQDLKVTWLWQLIT